LILRFGRGFGPRAHGFDSRIRTRRALTLLSHAEIPPCRCRHPV